MPGVWVVKWYSKNPAKGHKPERVEEVIADGGPGAIRKTTRGNQAHFPWVTAEPKPKGSATPTA